MIVFTVAILFSILNAFLLWKSEAMPTPFHNFANTFEYDCVDKFCLEYKEKFRSLLDDDDIEIRNVTGYNYIFDNEGKLENYPISECPQAAENCVKKTCPFDDEGVYIFDEDYVSESSFSPWKWVKNINENRSPRILLETECLCDSCINPYSRRLDYSVSWKPISTTMGVKLWNGHSWEIDFHQIYIGCRCQNNEKKTQDALS